MDFRKLYSEAVKRDQDVRDAAFLSLTTSICGVAIRQLTVRDIVILDGIGSPFLCGGPHSVQDAARFLWLMSPLYCSGWWPAFRFGRRCRKIDDTQLTSGIDRYLEDTFQDAPGKKAGADGPDFASFAAHLVHRLASAYGWSIDEIMRVPLKVIFQQLKCIRHEREEKPELRSRRVLKVTGDALRLKNERNKLVNLLKRRALN